MSIGELKCDGFSNVSLQLLFCCLSISKSIPHSQAREADNAKFLVAEIFIALCFFFVLRGVCGWFKSISPSRTRVAGSVKILQGFQPLDCTGSCQTESLRSRCVDSLQVNVLPDLHCCIASLFNYILCYLFKFLHLLIFALNLIYFALP